MKKRNYTAVTLAALVLLAGGGVTQAGTYTVVGGQVTGNSIAIGKSSEASSPKDASVSSVAVGKEANATGEGSIAIGDSAQVKHDPTNTKENQDGAIAIGYKAVVKTTRGTAIGSGATVDGHESSAFGAGSQATNSLSLAIGSYAKSSVDRGVALGASSVADRPAGVAGYDFSTGTSTSNTSPVWKSTWGAVSVGKEKGKDEQTRQIIHVAAGSEDTDAVNVAQLKASKVSLSVGDENLILKTDTSDKGTSYTLSLNADALPKAAEITAGKGVSVDTSDPTKTVVKLNDNQDFTGKVKASQFNVGSSVSLNNNGLTVGSASLSSAALKIGSVTLNSAGLAFTGSELAVKASGINAGTKEITNVAEATNDTSAINLGQAKQLVGANKVSLVSGDNIAVTGSGTEYTVSLAPKVSLTDSNSSITTDLSGEGISIHKGQNPGTYLHEDGLTIAQGPSVTRNGINAAGKITGLSAGTEDSEAVNFGQLKKVKTKLDLATGEGNLSLEGSTSGKDDEGGRYVLSLSKNVNFDSVTIGETGTTLSQNGLVFGTSGVRLTNTGLTVGTVSITTAGISAGDQQIKNVKAGDSGSTDAVNVKQMEDHVKANTSKVVAGNDGIKVDITPDSVNGTTYTVSLNEDHTFTKLSTGKVKADEVQIGASGPLINAAGIKMANQKITGLSAGTEDSEAVNFGQLKKVKTKLDLATGEGNLSLEGSTSGKDDEGGRYVLSLSKNVNFDSVTIGETGTTLSQNGLVFGTSGVRLTNTGLTVGKVTITTEGISAGEQQIKNVKAGDSGSTDAANVKQMEDYVKDNKSSVAAGSGISVKETKDTEKGGTKYEVSLADEISFNGEKGDTTISSSGLNIKGGPSVTKDGLTFGDEGPSVKKDGIDAGNLVISGVKAGEKDTDAVNVKQMKDYVKDNKTTVSSKEGSGIKVTPSSNPDDIGGTNYDISLDKDISFDSVTTGDTTISKDGLTIAGGPSVTKEGGIDAAGKGIINAGTISGVADATNDDEAVNFGQLKKLENSLNDSKVTVSSGENITVTPKSPSTDKGGTEYTVALNDTVSVKDEVHVADTVHLSKDGVRVGESGPSMTQEGINAGGQVISNVAAGVNATDAVNVSQLNSAVNNVFRQVHSVEKHAQAGIAMAIATAGLPQAYLPGKSMMAISGGTYRGQSGYAFGFSHVTDNGRYVIKATGSGNSQGHFGASVGMGLQW